MGDFSDHALKQIIREKWCKPLLREIVNKLGCKLLYFGLPAQEALDIQNWIEYIDRVIAFQCRDYPNPSSPEQPRDSVIKLDNVLRELERKGHLMTYSLYDGYVEEVVIKGRDTGGNAFTQNEIVTLYNLDFCNQITTPLTYFDNDGQVNSCYKSEAIKRMMEMQNHLCPSGIKTKFVMFLTIHADFFADEERRILSQTMGEEMTDYFKDVKKKAIRPYSTIKYLKAYVYSLVLNAFHSSHFATEFLPAIYYKGIGKVDKENWLITFTVLGVHDKNPMGVPKTVQTARDFCKQSFLQIDSGKICTLQINPLPEITPSNSSVTCFKNSRMLSELW